MTTTVETIQTPPTIFEHGFGPPAEAQRRRRLPLLIRLQRSNLSFISGCLGVTELPVRGAREQTGLYRNRSYLSPGAEQAARSEAISYIFESPAREIVAAIPPGRGQFSCRHRVAYVEKTSRWGRQLRLPERMAVEDSRMAGCSMQSTNSPVATLARAQNALMSVSTSLRPPLCHVRGEIFYLPHLETSLHTESVWGPKIWGFFEAARKLWVTTPVDERLPSRPSEPSGRMRQNSRRWWRNVPRDGSLNILEKQR